MVNCVTGSDCSGGFASDVYKYAFKNGIPHASCAQYDADDHTCEPLNNCRMCTGTDITKTYKENCKPVENPHQYYVKAYSEFSGANRMKQEIYAFGPISCAVEATPNWENNYHGGIYSEKIQFPETNHIIAVVGWGVSDEGEEFWWGRNSWGTYWGENGFFQMKMYTDNLAIETDCTPGIPSYDKPVFMEEMPASFMAE